MVKEKGQLLKGVVKKVLLITTAWLRSTFSVSKCGILTASYSILSGWKIRERSCQYTDVGTEFLVLGAHFIPETALG